MTGSRISRIAVFTVAYLLVGLVHAFAEGTGNSLVVTAAQLINTSAAFDRRTVSIEGEVIGDVMKRDVHLLINILDGGMAIGVWADTDRLYAMLSAGGYAQQGDRVRVTGVMHRACPEHGGDLDIHLDKIELLSSGYRVAHPVRWTRVLAAILLCSTGIMFTLVWGRQKRSI